MKAYRALLILFLVFTFLLTVSCGGDDDDDDSSDGDDSSDDDDSTDDDDDDNNDDDATDDDDDTVDPLFQEVLDFMEEQFDLEQVPGGAIAIVLDGKLTHHAGVGVKRIDAKGAPVNSTTAFAIASVTKMLTSAGMMTLWDEKGLDLHAPVTDYVDFFDLADPHDPASLSVHQLLSHSAGLPDYFETICDSGQGALSEWVGDHTDFPLWSPPGRLWNYSNLGFTIAGTVLEQVAGEHFPDAMQERLFTPAGMQGMTFYPEQAMAGDHATGHYLDESSSIATVDLYYYDCAFAWPTGILFGNVNALAKFAELMLSGGGDLLSKDATDLMQAPHVETHFIPNEYYGYGLKSKEYKDTKMITHDGTVPGFRTTWWIAPEENFGVVVFINADYYDAAEIALKAADIFLSLEDVDPPDYSTPKVEWAKYTGTYDDPYELGQIVVYQDGNLDMFVNFPEWKYQTELIQYAVDSFAFDITGTGNYFIVTFFLDDQDQGEYFTTRAGVGVRVDEKEVKPGTGRAAVTYEDWLKKALPYTTRSPEDRPSL